MSNTSSELRLFLSVDIAGSTRLKNLKNHQVLLKTYQDRKILADRLDIAQELDKEKFLIESVLDEMAEDDFDWASLISHTFAEFDQTFHKLYLLYHQEEPGAKSLLPHEFYPWKALGDELIYSFKISDRKQLHHYVCAFLAAIRHNDRALKEKNYIRLKGSAWTAGFPVRNREIRLPMPVVNIGGYPESIYPYPALDYLGPDMDIGFRLGKYTWPGFLIVSMDLAQLLGQYAHHDQVRIKFLGWEKLKGVWLDRPYPIYWAVLPREYKYQNPYTEYEKGDETESALLKNWIYNTEEIQEAKSSLDEIKAIRAQLPKNLGFVSPYIVEENSTNDEIPESHKEILKLIDAINAHPAGPAGPQNTDDREYPPRTEYSQDELKKELEAQFFS